MVNTVLCPICSYVYRVGADAHDCGATSVYALTHIIRKLNEKISDLEQRVRALEIDKALFKVKNTLIVLMLFVCTINTYSQHGYSYASTDFSPYIDEWTKIVDTLCVPKDSLFWWSTGDSIEPDTCRRYYLCYYDYGEPPPEGYELVKLFYSHWTDSIQVCRGWTVTFEEDPIFAIRGDNYLQLYHVTCINPKPKSFHHAYMRSLYISDDYKNGFVITVK